MIQKGVTPSSLANVGHWLLFSHKHCSFFGEVSPHEEGVTTPIINQDFRVLLLP